MKIFCPDCNEENDTSYEYNECRTEIWPDEVIVPVYLRCVKCGHHFIGTIHYNFSHVEEIEHNEDYNEEDYGEE